MRTDIEKYISISIKFVVYAVCIILGYFALKFTFAYFAPFIVALIFSMIIDPLVRLFQKIKIGRGFSTLIAMILSFGSFITLSVYAIIQIIAELRDLYVSLPDIYDKASTIATQLVEKATNIYLQLTPEATDVVQNLLASIFDKMKIFLSTTLSKTPQGTINFVSSLSGTLVFLIITLIATFFFTKDKELIKKFFLRQFSPTWQSKLLSLKNDLFMALVGFIKAQSIILSVTFIESLIGLTIIGVNYAFLVALIIAFVDILPILGTGSIYVPWAIISILQRNYKLGISLLILYGVIVVVRYMIEPKIVGQQLGIHPIIALMSMFAGLKIIGVAGIILGPTLVVVVKACQTAGIIPKFK